MILIYRETLHPGGVARDDGTIIPPSASWWLVGTFDDREAVKELLNEGEESARFAILEPTDVDDDGLPDGFKAPEIVKVVAPTTGPTIRKVAR